MGIQEEIKQTKFINEFQKLVINQLYTGKWITNIISNQLKPYGLTIQQYNVLRILRGQDDQSISVNDISERMIDKMSNVSRLIDKLVNKELVSRTVNRADRRQADIAITPKGLQLVNEISAKEHEIQEHFKTLTEEEAKLMNNLLDKLRG